MQLDSDLLEGYCLYDSNAEPVICHGRLKKDYDTIQRENENGIIESSHGDVYIVANEMDDNCLLVSEISGTRLMDAGRQGKSLSACLFLLLSWGTFIHSPKGYPNIPAKIQNTATIPIP